MKLCVPFDLSPSNTVTLVVAITMRHFEQKQDTNVTWSIQHAVGWNCWRLVCRCCLSVSESVTLKFLAITFGIHILALISWSSCRRQSFCSKVAQIYWIEDLFKDDLLREHVAAHVCRRASLEPKRWWRLKRANLPSSPLYPIILR